MWSLKTPVVLHAQDIAKETEETFPHSGCGMGISWKTLTSRSKNSTTAITSGIAYCAPSASSVSSLALHQHQQPELYYFLSGEGVVEVDGGEYAVRQGSVVFVPGNARHSVRNASREERLVWLYVWAVDDISDVQYVFPNVEAFNVAATKRKRESKL